ncbi:MAG: hypothetical protein JW940_04700 [Polyangiaceae bacterium]|nr:hypothetical protein [Polyangiaceae bacterium]
MYSRFGPGHDVSSFECHTAQTEIVLSPLVALEMPPDVGPELSAAVLRSCNLALGADRCVQSSVEPSKPEAAWLAVLRLPRADPLLVRIELRESAAGGALFSVRQLEFHPSDAPLQRWATTGVVVAALVVSADRAQASRTEPEQRNLTREAQTQAAPPKPKPLAPAERAAPSKPSREPVQPRTATWSLDSAVLSGPGFDQGRWRIGLGLRPSVAPAAGPLLGWACVTASHRAGTVAATWWSTAVGGGPRVATSALPLALEARAGGVGTWLGVAATDGTEHAAGSRWRYGALGAVDLVVLASAHLQAMGGVTATATWPRVAIMSRGELAATEPIVRWALHGGLRWLL